jgi:tetratricopeptide (TPR) repeat protein
LALLVIVTVSAQAGGSALEEARSLYQRSEYTAALERLREISQPDAAVWFLRGQCRYMMGEAKSASGLLERAAALDPGSSQIHLWLARAYGKRAETSNFIMAPILAIKAHENFEAAVRLDPDNSEAINDLFEYYLEAPGFLGGGLDKAATLAARLRDADPAEYAYDQARLSEKRKQFEAAEQYYRRASELAPNDSGRLIDLGEFLAAHGGIQESDRLLARAHEIAPRPATVAFHRAKTYVESGRNVETARSILEQYLKSPLTPDDPPRYEAAKLLERARR